MAPERRTAWNSTLPAPTKRLERKTALQPSKPLREVVGSAETGKLPRTTIPRRSLKWRSPKRAVQMAEYVPQMLAFLAEFTACEFPLGCGHRSEVLHHRRGREGLRLLDSDWWAASCDRHNMDAENDRDGTLGEDGCGWLAAVNSATRHLPYHPGWTA